MKYTMHWAMATSDVGTKNRSGLCIVKRMQTSLLQPAEIAYFSPEAQ